MFAVADTDRLVADGVITAEQSREIEARARTAMVTLAVNAVLCFGIVAATLGLIFWLASATAVAVSGTLALAAGLLILARGREVYSMFGNAAALIGAGMLIGGACFELLDKYEDVAGWVMLFGGLIPVAVAGHAMIAGGLTARFVKGSILLMGVAAHLSGIGVLLDQHDILGLGKALFMLYAAIAIVGAGWLTDVRLITALAIVPFAQMLDTGTGYFHAAYVFYSPEPTLTILQMTVLIMACIWVAKLQPERIARHARILAMLGFVTANLSALVGSLWGDRVGERMWGPRYRDFDNDWEAYQTALEVFRESTVYLPEGFYSIAWALVLVAMIAWAAHKNQRGLFNAALTFAAIHAYTQMFESFGDEPLAWVIGGLGAIPLAWGMWRLNGWFLREDGQAEGT